MKLIVFGLFLLFALVSAWNCPTHWKLFDRVKGKWCITVIRGTRNVWDAEAECKKHGGVLSGVENEHEKNWIHEKGVHLLRHHHKHIHQGALWIGGRRRPGCLGVNKNKAGCVPWAPHAFEWTDGFTTGRSQFRFRPGQPDYLHNAQEFVYMHIIDRPYGKGDHGATPGSLDDVTGDTAMTGKNTLQFVRGIVCGKRAAR